MRNNLNLLAMLTIGALASCQSKLTQEDLKQQITEQLGKQKGIYAVAYKNLETGEELLILPTEKFHAASTMKTPVMIEVYKQVAEGKFSLTDSITIKNEFRSIVDSSAFSLRQEVDSEQELYSKVGSKASIHDLVYKMIISSSNLATNLIIELVNAKNVTQTMRDLGAPDIEVLRGVEDTKAFNKGWINTTTARDLMIIFEKMAEGETVSPEASQEMIAILTDQEFNTIIPAKLPQDVKVAHKTGSITGVHHDSGIVFLPDGRKYVLVLLSKQVTDEKAATDAMASVSESIYKYTVQ